MPAIDIDPPNWGDSGTKPPDGTQFDGGDGYDAQYVDWLWNNFGSAINQVNTEFDSNIDATSYKGQDIDSNGDGVVDRADYANDGNATSYKSNDIDTDGDGVVDRADDVDTWYRNTDIPKTEIENGNNAVGRELYVPSGKTFRLYEAGLEPNGSSVPSGLALEAYDVSNDSLILRTFSRYESPDPSKIYADGPVKIRLQVHNGTGSTQIASGGFVWTLD